MPAVATFPATKAGYRISEFAAACGMGRRTIYDLPPELRPKSIKIGHARIIVESPREYLQRLAEEQLGDTEAQQKSMAKAG